jgi:hypothetical protein
MEAFWEKFIFICMPLEFEQHVTKYNARSASYSIDSSPCNADDATPSALLCDAHH